MSGSQNLSVTIPQPAIAFLDPDGSISRPWLYFLLAIKNAITSGSSIPIPSQTLREQIISLFVEQAMSDVPELQPTASTVLLSLALSEPNDSKPPLNPIIAALLVSDINP